MSAMLRSILIRVVGAVALLGVAGLVWVVLGVVTTSPESAAKDAVSIGTQNLLVPGSFHVLKTVSYPGGKVVVYSARVRASGHVPAMEITGEQAVDQRMGHWAGSSGGWGGPTSNGPKNIADVSETAFRANDRSMYAVVAVRPLSPRARVLNLTYLNGRTAHRALHGRVFVTVAHATRVCAITISDAEGRVVWPTVPIPAGKRAAAGSCSKD
jgi:hypothetical protein